MTVAHRGKGGVHLAGFHADDIKTFTGQTIKEMLAQRASLKTNALDRMAKTVQAIGDIADLTR